MRFFMLYHIDGWRKYETFNEANQKKELWYDFEGKLVIWEGFKL